LIRLTSVGEKGLSFIVYIFLCAISRNLKFFFRSLNVFPFKCRTTRRSRDAADLAIGSVSAIGSDATVDAPEVDPRIARRTGSGQDRENDRAIGRASVTDREREIVSAPGSAETSKISPRMKRSARAALYSLKMIRRRT